jgi:hypothetical protein
MIGLTAYSEAVDPQALATIVHDDILQWLGAAVLGVDLTRRLHHRARYEQALDELSSIVDALSAALAASERLLPQLREHATANTPVPTRPSLMVVVDVLGQAALNRPAASPDEIVQTIAACERQARRSQRAYDAGLGEDALEEIDSLHQRLEWVVLAFRTL